MKLNKLIKKINRENSPPNGWKPEDKVQAASSKRQATSFKPPNFPDSCNNLFDKEVK